ncbi:metallopeptidase TldD-related protein, partial [Acinetobacter baumannii]
EKAERSRNPIALEPGNYTVVLEPNAVGDLLGLMMGFFGARAAAEGRSFFSRKGGGNHLGEKLFDERVHIYTDPQYAAAP